MRRIYHQLIQQHVARFRKMIFLTGPRQAGKTTLASDASQESEDFALKIIFDKRY